MHLNVATKLKKSQFTGGMVVGGERTWQQTEAAKLKPYTATHGGGGGAKEGFVSAQPISRLKLHVSQNLKINVVGFLFRWKSFTKSFYLCQSWEPKSQVI